MGASFNILPTLAEPLTRDNQPTGGAGKGGSIQPLPISQPVYQPMPMQPPLGGYFAQYMNQMQQPYMPQQYAPQAGSIVDPTVNAAFDVLNRAPVQRALPELRGSGVNFLSSMPTAPMMPDTPYRTANYTGTPTAAPTVSSGDSGGYQDTVDNSAWSNMTDAEKAAYYAENPTMGSITRALNTGMQYTLPGAAINYFDPGAFTRNDAIAAGMDPTGWQFAERQSDGLLGTQIGGSLTFPELSPENFGPYAFPETNAPVVGNYVADAPVASPVSSPVGIDAFGGTGPYVDNIGIDAFGGTGPYVDNIGIDAFGGAGPDVGSVGIDAFGGAGPSVDTGSVGIDAFGGYGSDVGSVGIDAFGGSGPSVDTGSVGIDAFGGAGPSVDTVGIDAFGGAGPDVSSGGDGGGGGGKIICTAMNQAYGFGSFRNAIWIAYADKHLSKAHEVGYHTLFLPLVDFGFKRGDGKMNMAVRKVLEWGTRHRSTDLRAEMRGTKRDTTGRIIRLIFEPLCYAVGKLKGY